MKGLIDYIGWLGAVFVLIAYGLASFNIVDGRSVIFQLLNLLGALGLTAVCLKQKAYPPAALNGIWSCIAAVALCRITLGIT